MILPFAMRSCNDKQFTENWQSLLLTKVLPFSTFPSSAERGKENLTYSVL